MFAMQRYFFCKTGVKFESNEMKRSEKYFAVRMTMLLLVTSILSGCGGYARTPNGSSGVEMYGVIDVGVQHDSR